MPGLNVFEIASELRRQKAKYHAKTISDGALYAGWLRGFDMLDLLPFYVWLEIPPLNFAGFSMSLTFDIPPIDVEPINVDFQVQLPELEELLQGILVDIQPIDLSELYEWLASVDDFVYANFPQPIADQIIGSRLRKGVYGETPYSQSYYDPVAVREFLRSTFLRLAKERRTVKQLRDDMASIAERLNLVETLPRLVFNRIMLTTMAQEQTMILGYGVLGVSRLAPRGSDLAKVTIVDYDLEAVEAKFTTLDHLQYGMILGLTPLGTGYLLPRESVYKREEKQLQQLHATEAGPQMVDMVAYKARRILRTYSHTPLAFANYSRPDERLDYLRSERADQWMILQALRYHVESLVDNILAGEDNPVRIRMYKSAALQLIAARAKRHRWGYRGYQAMSEDEFRDHWLQHWSSMGLDPAKLTIIYQALQPVIDELRWWKWKQGARLRRTRYRLALLSKT